MTHKNFNKDKKAVEDFIKSNGYEPTAIDFDLTDYLPSARTIQRNYGGLPQFRALLGLKTSDFTKGKHRAGKALQAGKLCRQMESDLFRELLAKYDQSVSSPAYVYVHTGHTVDYRLDTSEGTFLFDVFYPTTTHSFVGCVGIKNAKHSTDRESFYTERPQMFLVCLNEDVMKPIKSAIPILSLSEFRSRFL
jgi:hypothetical protein